MNKIIWHIKQLYRSWETRRCKGNMSLFTYHCFRISKLWEYRYSAVDIQKDTFKN